MAIGGGCLMPPMQGAMIDLDPFPWLSAVRASFTLPLLCFFIIAGYGWFNRRPLAVAQLA